MHIMYIEDVELTGGGYAVDEIIKCEKNVVYTQGKLFIGEAHRAFPAVAKFTRHNKGVIIGFNDPGDCDFCCNYFNKLIGDNRELAMSILTRTADRVLVGIMALITAFNLFRCLRYILTAPSFDMMVFIVPAVSVLILAASVKYVFFRRGAMYMFPLG